MVVVEATSPVDMAVVRSCTSACSAVGLMVTAAVAEASGSFDWEIIDEVINIFCRHVN